MTEADRVQRLHALIKLAKSLTAGDFDRLMRFAETLQATRQGKRQQRSVRRQKPLQEHWRIGR